MLPRELKIVVSLVVFHISGWNLLWYLTKENLECHELLTKHDDNSTVWKPTQCKLHTYNKIEVKACFQRRMDLYGKSRVVFLGDSHLRGLFYEMKTLAGSKPVKYSKDPVDLFAKNLPIPGVEIDFLWKPFLNESYTSVFCNWANGIDPPDLFITGAVLHTITTSKGSSFAKNEFRKNLTRISALYDRVPTQIPSLWYIQPPTHDERLKPARLAATNGNVDDYNKIATQVISGTDMVLWTSTRALAKHDFDQYHDDVHINQMSRSKLAQVLLNYYCNRILQFSPDVCCTQATGKLSPMGLELLRISIFLIPICIGFWFFQAKRSQNVLIGTLTRDSTTGEVTPSQGILWQTLLNIAKFASIVLFVYVIGSSPVFKKMQLDFRLGETVAILFLVCSLSFIVQTSPDLQFSPDVELKGVIIFIYILLKFNGIHIQDRDEIIWTFEGALLTMFGLEVHHLLLQTTFSIIDLFRKVICLNLLALIFCMVLLEPYQNYKVVSMCTLCLLLLVPVSVITTLVELVSKRKIPKVTRGLIILAGGTCLLAVFKKFNIGLELIHLVQNREGLSIDWMKAWNNNFSSVFAGISLGFISELFQSVQEKISGKRAYSLIFRSFIFVVGVFTLIYSHLLNSNEYLEYHVGNLASPGTLMVFGVYATFGATDIYRPRNPTIFHCLGLYWLEILVLSQHVLLCCDEQILSSIVPNSIIASSLLSIVFILVASEEVYTSLSFLHTS